MKTISKNGKKGFKIWVHSGPVFSFSDKISPFFTKKLGIVLEFFVFLV
jgi:hypothetical protein